MARECVVYLVARLSCSSLGSIPAEIGSCSALTGFNIAGQYGMAGSTLPATISLLTRLSDLRINNIGLIGEIPPLDNLTAMTVFMASENKLVGNAPSANQFGVCVSG
jgi:hypothetical protein